MQSYNALSGLGTLLFLCTKIAEVMSNVTTDQMQGMPEFIHCAPNDKNQICILDLLIGFIS